MRAAEATERRSDGETKGRTAIAMLAAWAVLLMPLALLLAAGGCAMFRITDGTAVARAGFEAQKPTPIVLPAGTAMPENAIVFQTMPGKNTKLTMWHENGQKKLEWEATASVVLESMLGGLGDLDAQKLAYDAQSREMFWQLVQLAIKEGLPLLKDYLAGGLAPPASGGGGANTNIKAQIEAFLATPAGRIWAQDPAVRAWLVQIGITPPMAEATPPGG